MYFVGEKRDDNYVNEELHDKLKYVNKRVGHSKQLNNKRNTQAIVKPAFFCQVLSNLL
jgi:hypothetical protein